MKSLILAIVILIVAAGIAIESRYTLVVDSPVVAKIDRLTGEVWIANSGAWRKIDHCPKDNCIPESNVTPKSDKKSK